MRRTWMALVLAFFTFSGFLMAFGGEDGKREDYQKQIELRLRTLRQNLDEQKARSSILKDDAKVRFDEDMRIFREKEKIAAAKLQRLRAATARTWGRGKAGVEAAMQDLNRQYEILEERLKNP
ncbi:sll1863 family stress response protein [Geotalea toluenoxydans]|uniref:hypothetical protein n=1 Tax=Geotalea toluenoxydans TaxID=421624 RepID=UPI0006D12FC2|nr:hypothetical protein [Geotalea toluenoxydans]